MIGRHLCPKLSISIRGVEFCSNLIVLESKGLDIILGMDWLTKYNETIECATRTVHLRHPEGTTVEYQASPKSSAEARLNQTEAVSGIRVINEFPDEFPKELPGMPPERFSLPLNLFLALPPYTRGPIEWMPIS